MKKVSAILVLLSISSTVFAGTCNPFAMEVQVSGSTITFENLCTPDAKSIASMRVSFGGKSVRVDSATLSSPNVDVKQAINKRITEGVSLSDAQIIVNQINPALQRGELVEAKLALIDLVITEQ